MNNFNNSLLNNFLIEVFGLRRVENFKDTFKSPYVSFILILIFAFGSQYITIEVNIVRLSETLKESSFSRLIDFLGGGSFSKGSIFTFSVLFMIITRLLMNYVPFYRKKLQQVNDGNSYEKRILGRHTFYFDLIVALVFTAVLVIYLAKNGIFINDKGGFIKPSLFYLSGAVFLILIVNIINKSYDGILAVLVTSALLSIFNWFINVFDQFTMYYSLWSMVGIVGSFFLAIITAILLEKYVVKVPYQFMRPTQSKVKLYIPINSRSPVGINRLFSTFLVLIIAYVFDLLFVLSGNFQHGFFKILIGFVIPFFVSMIYGIYTNIESNYIIKALADNLQSKNAIIPGIKPGVLTTKYLNEKAEKPLNYESSYVIFGLLIVQIANSTIYPLTLHPLALIMVWPIVIVCKDAINKIKNLKANIYS